MNQKNFIIKAILLGNDNVGKSSISQAFIDKTYVEQKQKFCGIEFKSKTVQVPSGPEINLQIWQGLKSINQNKIVFRNAQIIVLIFDLTDRESYQSIQSHLEYVNNYANLDDVVIYLLGNKKDLIEKRAVTQEEASHYASSKGVSYGEVSAKSCDNIDYCFIQMLRQLLFSGKCLPGMQIIRNYDFNDKFGGHRQILAGLKVKDQVASVPLKHLDIKIDIIGHFANVTLCQTYRNSATSPIDCEYFFAITPNCCFNSFRAEVDGNLIEGSIKEREAAKQEFLLEKMKGDTVAFAQIEENLRDVMCFTLGNLQSNEEMRITFSYIQELSLISSQNHWSFVLPSTLTPSYSQMNQIPQKELQFTPYALDLLCRIQQNAQITLLECPSHQEFPELEISFEDEFKTLAKVKFGNQFGQANLPLDRDFVLVFCKLDANIPKYDMQCNKEQKDHPYCANITFTPKFENAVKESVKMNGREFIFLLDRSGSMSGTRINLAKRSLVYFLKSLPINSSFNIVSFGTQNTFLYNQSQKYENLDVQNAIDQVGQFTANLGGTEILQVLKKVFHSGNSKNEAQKILFLLTDGDVANPQEIVSLIKQQNQHDNNNIRVFTLGIGNGCSRYLIQEAARAGRGTHQFVSEAQFIPEKVIGMLQDALSAYGFASLQIKEEDQQCVALMHPYPEIQHIVIPNRPFQAFIFLKEEFNLKKQIEVRLKFTFNDQKMPPTEHSVIIQNDDQFQQMASNDNGHSTFFHKYGIFQICSALLENDFDEKYKVVFVDEEMAKLQDFKNIALNLAIQHQVLTNQTAFICSVKSNVKNNNEANLKAIIPLIQSIDVQYAQNQHQNIKLGNQQQILYSSNKSSSCCGGGGGGGSGYSQQSKAQLNGNSLHSQESKEKATNDVLMSNQCDSYDLLFELIKRQHVNGKWEKDIALMQMLQMTENLYKKIKLEVYSAENEMVQSQSQSQEPINFDDVLMTIVVLLWIQQKCKQQEAFLVLIVSKINSWLAARGITNQILEHYFKIIFQLPIFVRIEPI